MRHRLEGFLEVVKREMGIEPSVPPPARIGSLPPPLATFYEVAAGLDLPFIEIYPASSVEPSGMPQWVIFGADPYFSYCLCRTAARWDLDLWDHDSGVPPEGGLTDVIELLQASYDAVWEAGAGREGHVVVQALPKEISLAAVVADLKSLGLASSAALFAGLRRLPLEIYSGNAEDAIQVMRRLHAKGVQCHWTAAQPKANGEAP